MEKKDIEIPFGAFDSELGGFEYTIPEGYKAEIKDGRVIVKKAESEDERIRKDLLGYLHTLPNHFSHNGSLVTEWLAWLEKQGDYNRLIKEIKECKELFSKEKKKAISTNDKLSLGGRIAMLEELLAFTKENQGEQTPADKVEPKFKHGDRVRNKKSGLEQTLGSCIEDVYEGAFPFRIKDQDDWELVEQKSLWSEKDEKMFNSIIHSAENHCYINVKERNWLKSLKERYIWKPNDEQMYILNWVANILLNHDGVVEEEASKKLQSLYNDLKKLKE